MSRPGHPRVRRLSQLSPAHWGRVVVRAAKSFFRDNGTDLAAALTFWSLLSLFPAAIVVVALVELVIADEAILATLTEIIQELAPAEIATTIETRLVEVVGQRSTAGVLLSFGVLGALWTSSAYLRSFTRASNIIYRTTEDRPLYRLVPLQLLLTVVALLLIATVVAGLVVSGPVAAAVGQALGVEETLVRIWNLAKWPVLLAIAAMLLSLLFWVAPSVQQPRFRWLTVGGAVALVVWAAASAGFGFYVANFGAYDVTYGALGAVIVFLLWLFLTNCAVLLGVEVNAELRRFHEVAAEPAS
ncbi:YihY/virulence factor BrkB family protein [Natronosporangium hydrolyticum]|uniref:YihY/virulence factor BrkB family protein n=1 Tax=Natronosporangium hydrolyticum TaxID=2811111 RepID=A0A895YQA2_9ACTN|nr:YihY/virulence factor BrkB family protein [Natronosporangium hydrolyticum]QSB16916.1 YihY/virulence factor BrkB family protein [Natronosporangium hydrolyticum]